MCLPLLAVAGIVSAVAAVGSAAMSGVSGMQAGKANAAMAKAEGKQLRIQSEAEAGSLAGRGAYQIGGMRSDVAGTGNLSALDLVGQSATNLSLDVERIKHAGRAGQAQSGAAANYYTWQGRNALYGGLAQGIIGAGTQLLSSFGGGSSVMPSVGVYGNPGARGA